MSSRPSLLLHRLRQLTSGVLAWFVLSLGVAVAAPLIKPQAVSFICSSAGVMKVLVTADDGSQQEAPSHALDCPLCVHHLAPPPPDFHPEAQVVQPLRHAVQRVPAAIIASRTAPPLGARGPPAFS